MEVAQVTQVTQGSEGSKGSEGFLPVTLAVDVISTDGICAK